MKILYSRTSLKYLQGLNKKTAGKIIEAIDRLPSEGDVKKLKGEKAKNIFRLRIGRYRIIFARDKEAIKIVKIDTRGDVYKQ
jgi:mRNA interferase RelE/StbE